MSGRYEGRPVEVVPEPPGGILDQAQPIQSSSMEDSDVYPRRRVPWPMMQKRRLKRRGVRISGTMKREG